MGELSHIKFTQKTKFINDSYSIIYLIMSVFSGIQISRMDSWYIHGLMVHSAADFRPEETSSCCTILCVSADTRAAAVKA